MLKRLAIAAFGIALLFAVGPNESPAQQKQNGQNVPEAPVTITNNSVRQYDQNATNQESPEAHAGIEWANWALVIVGLITAWAVWKQAQESAKATGAMRDSINIQKNAADAAFLSAKAFISAERPWIVLETRIQKSGAFMFFVKNIGKSAAKITSIRNRVPVVTESLTDTPEYPPEYELLKSPVLLPPGEIRYIGDFDFNDFKTKNPPSASSIQFGGGKSLYLYGRVEYLAMPEMPEGEHDLWETRYCRWYVPMEIPAFIESNCPDGYNQYK